MQNQILMPKLQVAGVDKSQIIVLEFEGKQAISELYSFNIEFVSKTSIQAKQVINQKAQLIFAKKGSGTTPLHGEVVSFVELDDIDEYHRYKMCLMPKVHRLQYTRETQVFLDKSIPQVIKQILNKNGITQVELDLITEHKPKEFIFQYNEVDWDFVTRWMEIEGLFYYFSQDKSNEKLVITDSNSTLKNNQDINEIYYQAYTQASQNNPTANLVYNYQLTTAALPKQVIVKSYYQEQSSKPYTSKVMIDESGHGEVNFWGENIKSNKENQQLAKYISESYKCKKEILTGISSASLINPGTIINHKKFKTSSLNVPMLIISSIYSGSQKRSFESLHSGDEHSAEGYFKCEYQAINKSTPYRQTIQDRIPRISGMLPAFVDHEGKDDLVQIDKKGMYKFRLVISNDKPGKGSAWVRKMESYIGDQYSFHLPLRKGDEVLIGFQFGNPDLPVIIGAVCNSTHRNILSSRNQNYMGLYTKENNMMFINEQAGKTKGMQFSSANNRTSMVVGTDNIFKSQLDAGYVLTTDSSKYQRIGKNSVTNVSKDNAMDVGGDMITTVTGTTVHTCKGDANYNYYGARMESVLGLDFISRTGAMIETTSGFQVSLSSGWRYEQDTTTSLKTAPEIMLDAEATISLTVGACSLVITPAAITLQAPAIEMVAPTTITLSAPTINMAALDVNISGIISGGPFADLGAGAGEGADVAAAEAEVIVEEELVLATGTIATLKATAIAAVEAGKEGYTLMADTFGEIASVFKAEIVERVDEAVITPITAKAGSAVATANKGLVLGPGLAIPGDISKETGG